MTDDDAETLEVSLNVLTFLEAEHGWIFGREGQDPSCEEILKFLCRPNSTARPSEIVTRYKEITGDDHTRLAVLPAEPNIFEKIVLPLRAAIGCYMVGSYLGTLAICGMVCEMLAILTFDLAMLRAGDQRLDEEAQKVKFNSTFERLGQSERIKHLKNMNLIDPNTERLFRVPQTVRRGYLHFFSKPHEVIAADARAVWEATRDLVLLTFKPKFDNGALLVDPTLLDYLRRHTAGND